MLNMQEIRELINLIDKSSIDEFIYKASGSEITLKKNNIQTAEGKKVTQEQLVEQVAYKEEKTEVQNTITENEIVHNKIETKNDNSNLIEITSPMVGTFYQASAPGADPFVNVGSKISSGTTVCIVEAMKLFNEIEAEIKGEIVEILVSDGQLVEFGQPLFLVKQE